MKLIIVWIVFVFMFLSQIAFSSGMFYSLIDESGTTWSQVLTFTVRHVVTVNWEYDEGSQIPIDPEKSEGVIGDVTFVSNKKFKFLVNAIINDNSLQSIVNTKGIKMGSENINFNEIVNVSSKKIGGTLSLIFDIDWNNLTVQDFPVTLEFTFLPF